MSAFLDENGGLITVDRKNPLPTSTIIGGAALSSAMSRQNVFMAHGVTVPASPANLSKCQIWNPAGSQKMFIVYIANAWHTAGSVTYKASLSSSQLSSTETSTQIQNVVSGSSVVSDAKIYIKNNDASSALNVVSQATITTTVSNGTNISPIIQGIILPDNGFNLESLTQNMAVNFLLVWAEVDLSEIPNV